MDILTYGCFSEGEKQKIDLALTFAWRDIAKKRNSASCNLLIMDEVLDGSLDSDSSIDLLQILDTFSSDTNIFVISHRPDLYYDKFRNIITFKKTKNFSKIVEN
jgi:ABC-type multidrug transport system ATPase subunit